MEIDALRIDLRVEGRDLVVRLRRWSASGEHEIASASIPASSITVAAGVMVDKSDDI